MSLAQKGEAPELVGNSEVVKTTIMPTSLPHKIDPTFSVEDSVGEWEGVTASVDDGNLIAIIFSFFSHFFNIFK